MRVRKSFLFVILSLTIVIGIPTGFIKAQTPDRIFVEETGHWIEGKFLEMYQSVDDPLLIFGYPLTERAVLVETGMTVQYFENVRMDLVEGEDGGTIELADLGSMLYTPGSLLVNIPSNSGACRYFPQTGKSVCYAFLQFYDVHNGEFYFGNPISDLEHQADGRYVLYFERARMEWWPELEPERRVMLTKLGDIYLNEYGRSLLREETLGDFSIAAGDVQPRALAFVTHSLIPAGEQQTIFIIAQDQKYNPLPNAMAMVVITLPDGTQDIYRPPVTDEYGISQLEYTVPNLEPRQVVQVDVFLQYQAEETTTATWFRTWW